MTSSIWNVQTRSAGDGVKYQPAGVIFAVDGTAYPGAPGAPIPITNDGTGVWSGFSSGIVGGLENVADGLWGSICIGYEASTIPMWPSVQQGRGYLVAAIQNYTAGFSQIFGFYPPIVLTGYSQGSMITDQVWVLDILAEDGVLHYLLPYVYRIYQFGHVFRCPGIAHGNALAGLPESILTDGVESGGIGATLDLTEAQTNYVAPDGSPVVYSCANAGDIYTCAPTGPNPWTGIAPQGKTGELFFQIVMQPTLIDLIEAAEVLATPIASIEEGINAGTFFAEGPGAPHYLYFPQMLACINDAVQLGQSLPHLL
jgi:hypothetical protein